MQVCVVKGYPKWFWIITFTSDTICYCKKFKIVIYIKSTILKLEKNLKDILEILIFLCILNMLNFKRLALIATEIQSDETKNSGSSSHPIHDETKSFGSTRSPDPLDATAKKITNKI